MEHKIEVPVLLIAFNRPDITKNSFNSIREVRPKKLYVAIDGPRSNKQDEAKLCKQVLHITQNVDWECDTQYLIREKNLGCKLGVTGAISWALSNEDRVIVIEDDIVAVPAFFSYAQELLERYKDNERIAMISANQYTPIEMENDYLFTKYGHIWGWATWKRVWDNFDVNVPELETAVNSSLPAMSFESEKEKKYYKKYFSTWLSRIKHDTENAWGPQFTFFRFQNSLLSVAPKVNLASNIGNVSSRTNNVAITNQHYYPATINFKLVNFPIKIECDKEYDKYHFKNHINRKMPLYRRAFIKLSRKIIG